MHRPDTARLDPAVRRTLRRLASNPHVRLVVLSGRSLPNIKRRVGVKGIIYGGCHGLEIDGPGLRFRHPLTSSIRRRIRTAAAVLDRVIPQFPGAHLEQKGLALAVHYRGVRPSQLGTLRRWVKRVASQMALTMLPGKKVWDLLPPGHRGKSKAVNLIRSHFRNRWGGMSFLTVYAGDDTTDAEAFRSLGARGIGIQVGGRARGAADYRLRGVRGVHTLLRWIAERAPSSASMVARPRTSVGRGARRGD